MQVWENIARFWLFSFSPFLSYSPQSSIFVCLLFCFSSKHIQKSRLRIRCGSILELTYSTGVQPRQHKMIAFHKNFTQENHPNPCKDLFDFCFLFLLVFNKRSLVDAFTMDDPTAFGYDKREEATKKSDIENQRKKKSS